MGPTMTVIILWAAAIMVAAVAVWQLIHYTSPLVRSWTPSSFKRHSAGPLSVLDSGRSEIDTGEIVILLHGLGATSDYFGDFYDGLSRRRRVILIDLLGFGGSLDEARTDFSLEAHVKALDEAFEALGIGSSRIIVAAHSMGAGLALTWANRHPGRVVRVVLWGAPVYDNESDARNIGASHGAITRLFLLDTRWAERACHVSCRHRTTSGRAMALMAPRWPVPISTRASLHTWDAYQQSLNSLVLTFDWATVLPGEVEVTIFRGATDPIGNRSYLEELVGEADLIDVAGGGHHIALTNPELLYDLLEWPSAAASGQQKPSP